MSSNTLLATHDEEEDDGISSETAATINLINNIVGAGMFSMPWCLMECTLVTGVVLMLFMCFLNAASFLILAECCELAGSYSYLEMGRKAFGERFGTVVQVSVICYALGSLISFVVLTGDFLIGHNTGVLEVYADGTPFYGKPYSRWLVLGLVAVVIFFPLSMLRNIEPLKYTSFISFVSCIYAGFICFYTYVFETDPWQSMTHAEAIANNATTLHSTVEYAGFPVGVFAAIPIFNVAFTAHYNGPRFYKELRGRSQLKFARVVGLTMLFSGSIYLITAVFGYLTFGNMTVGDILKNFNPDYGIAIAARLALACVVIFTFPLANHSVREGIIQLYWGGEYSTDTLPADTFLYLTIALVVPVTVIGIECTQVEDVLAYKGGIFGSLMVYIFPALLYVRLKTLNVPGRDLEHSWGSGVDKPKHSDYARLEGDQQQELEAGSPIVETLRLSFQTREYRPHAFLFTWGVVTGILGVVITILTQAGVIAGG